MALPRLNPVELAPPAGSTDRAASQAQAARLHQRITELERRLADEASASKIVSGRVSSTGTILAGTGFTVTKGTTGVYTINFTSLSPVALVPTIANGNTRICATMTYTVTSVVVRLYTTAAANVDDEFAFIASAT